MAEPITPPATIGVLGGGQLGRYLVMAARTMGYRTMVLEPDPAAPAGAVAHEHLIAAYDDPTAVDHLAAHCAVVTTEFENAPASTLARLAQRVRVAPSPQAVAITQDRMVEKTFLTSMGCAVGPYRTIASSDDVSAGGDVFPAILKTARLGYDGKGQITVDQGDDLARAWDRLGRVPCVLEERLPLEAELSVVLARNPQGQVAAFAPTQNHHRDGILDLSIAPVTGPLAPQATALAVRIAEALDYVGVLGVEMFVVNGTLLVNELAPRPHNSGHWTLDGARTSQFEQQVRAICGLALGDTALTVPAIAMVNLLGDCWRHGEPHWAAALSSPSAHLHLYGKAEPRPGRKMGHLTVTGTDAVSVARQARAWAEACTLPRR
jgi:5-(carboxyamino)imidazole ribonucleotide synthase